MSPLRVRRVLLAAISLFFMSKQIELLRKIKELAKRGVGGEAVNAQKQLDILLKKYNLTLEDIEEEKKELRFIKAKDSEIRLLNQIIARVDENIKMWVLPAKKVKEFSAKGNVVIECSAANFIEIEQMFFVYNKLYKKELEIFYEAFLKANDLLVKGDNTTSELSEEEYEKWKRVDKLSRNIKTETVRKQLEAQTC